MFRNLRPTTSTTFETKVLRGVTGIDAVWLRAVEWRCCAHPEAPARDDRRAASSGFCEACSMARWRRSSAVGESSTMTTLLT